MHKDKAKHSTITALILSGGAGNRFGGVDKGLQEHLNKPLVEHVIDALKPQVGKLLISINRNPKTYTQFGLNLVIDQSSTHQGPMAGIVAGIEQLNAANDTTTEALLVSPCDSPTLPADYVFRLNQQLDSQSTQSLVAVVHDGNRRQNLHCLIRRKAWPSLCYFYAADNRAMHKWFEVIGVNEVDFSDQSDCFTNINTSDQLA